ncbi:MAG: chromosomal replication initiator protein DnaA [Dehalococcoidales bacterium]|nr:chromosomal replication initiator protein DnaA [Dehalococcoidales bacterium]
MQSRSAQEIWATALGELQVQVSKANYRTWLEKTKGLSYQDNQFVVGVPNAFIAEYLDQNQRSLIEKTLIGIVRRDVQIIFSIDTGKPGNYHASTETTAITPAVSDNLNPRYTFGNFVVSNCNRLAHAGALAVAENPGHSYNPLFICGGVGLGKTHLLHAIGHTALKGKESVLYVSGEQFTNEFIGAIRNHRTEEFRSKYRSTGTLLIDDIQFLSGKEQTEECFFHTFNELHNANHQIVITSDRTPQAMPLLGERLRSRFEWGLVADIQPPDYETRLAILHTKAEQAGAQVAPDVLEIIAQRIQQNIRELEGNLNRVIAYARLLRTLMTPELAARALADIGSKNPNGVAITTAMILEEVANCFQLELADLRGEKRDKETALARQVAMYLIKQETNYSLSQIGQEVGGRNPSTVRHACEKISNGLDTSPHLKRQVLEIQQRLHETKHRNY